MTEEQIYTSIKSGELQLDFWQKFTHYQIVIYSFFVSVLPVFLFFYDLITDNQKPFNFGVFWLSLFGIVGVVYFFIQKKRLQFTPVKTDLEKEELRRVINETGNYLKWQKVFENQNVIVGKTPFNWSHNSWGEQITVIFVYGYVLLNSICDPDKKSSVVASNKNMRNVKMFAVKIADTKELSNQQKL